jgi:ABC-type multidrug transport system fused ATPase/permease subunit
MVYRKALRVHQDTAKDVGAGSSTSLMSVDVERIVLQCEPFHLLYSSLIMVTIGLVILYNTVGASFVATVIVAVAFFMCIPLITRSIPRHQKAWSARTDLRVKLFNSAIRNIKALKMSGYEEVVIQKLKDLRDLEIRKQMVYYKWLVIVASSEYSTL